jgi:hypothetical protein
MTKTNVAVAALCCLIIIVFAYSFWIGIQNTPRF